MPLALATVKQLSNSLRPLAAEIAKPALAVSQLGEVVDAAAQGRSKQAPSKLYHVKFHSVVTAGDASRRPPPLYGKTAAAVFRQEEGIGVLFPSQLPHHSVTLSPREPIPNIAKRWSKKSAKMGQHLLVLDEMAHRKSREEAAERRKKKKDRKAAKKMKMKGGGSKSAAASASASAVDDEAEDDEEHDVDEEEVADDDDDENALPDPADVKARMVKIVDSFVESLKGIRGAEPSPELFDRVLVDAYGSGSRTTLKSVAQVVIETPTMATATCFDPATAKSVAEAIRDQIEGMIPYVEEDGVVRIPIPRVSTEVRQQTAKVLNKRVESYRRRVRNVRRKAMDVAKKGVAGKLEHVSKDDAFRVQTQIETDTDQVIKTLNDAADKKRQSIMAV